MLGFSIVYPITLNIVTSAETPKLNQIQDEIKLSEIYEEYDVFYVENNKYNTIYVCEGNSIIAYNFLDKDRFTSTGKEVIGRATLVDMQRYFGDNLHYGKPKPMYVYSFALPVGLIIPAVILISIIILGVVVHKMVENEIFELSKTDETLKKLRQEYKDDQILKSQYNKLRREYFSDKILKDNKILSMLKFLY